jgi:hypothetical protein
MGGGTVRAAQPASIVEAARNAMTRTISLPFRRLRRIAAFGSMGSRASATANRRSGLGRLQTPEIKD